MYSGQVRGDTVEEQANNSQGITSAEVEEHRSESPAADNHDRWQGVVDPARVLSEVEMLARGGASGGQILEFILKLVFRS